MNSATYLSRSVDYLGDLGAKLRDLQGYRTLAYELIQNADDAPANWMSFDLQRDALILDNAGVFADCGDVGADECHWSSDGIHNHRCDFHRFRLIGAGDKRLQEGTTSAFGIGFIAVYQLTDQPELISAGRHWLLHEERSEGERIEVCLGCAKCIRPDLPGTRFILPFARDQQSPLRRALKADAVPEGVVERLLAELEQSLPVAMIFLKNLREIEIKDSSGLRTKFARVNEGDTVIISHGAAANDRVWHLLHGDFESEATGLRQQHLGRIEDKRSAAVVVALPTEDLSAGLLCASLPTEESPGLPFHVNADFFPSNDRKHVILGEDYQAQWNRAALSAAAKIVADATPRITRMLGAVRFWHLAYALNSLSDYADRNNRDGVWKAFWDALAVALREQSVVFTSSREWTTASSGVALLLHRDEAISIPVLEGLGIKVVAEELRPYQALLRSVGVPALDIDTLCSALTRSGLDKPVCFDDLPSGLTSASGREALWAEIAILLARQGNNPHAKRADEQLLSTVALAPAVNKALWPSRDVFLGDTSTVRLLASLGLDVPFLDQTEGAFEPLKHLCSALGAEDVIDVLEECDGASIQERWVQGHSDIPRLIAWFENRREQIVDDEEMRERLAALPIYPSAGQLRPLTNLVLPGDFEDPIGLTNLVDVDSLSGKREFLIALGVAELDFRTYVLDHLSHALDDDELISVIGREAVALLADHLGELIDDEEVKDVLASTRLIECTDGEYRRAADCYFPDSIVPEVLGGDANIVVLPEERTGAVQRLLDWLGVASDPRLRDIVQAVHRIADGSCSPAGVLRIQNIVAHLGTRFERLEGFLELEALRSIEWLPARGDTDRWHQPSSLYAPYRSYLFESQGGILDIRSPNRDLLDFLGVHIDPPPDLAGCGRKGSAGLLTERGTRIGPDMST